MQVMRVVELVFWIGIAVTLYAYALFPAIIATLAAVVRHRDSTPGGDRPLPSVSVLVPAYNEERSIAGKLANLLGMQYPRELLEVIVISDASTDQTDDIVRRFERDGVRVLRQASRRGKTAGLNMAVPVSRGEILIFTDANATFPPEAIATLAGYFSDPTVGLVSGFTRYAVDSTGRVGEATNLYTALERTIKRAEGVWGCCVGADGAIFAMRRALYRQLRADDINDFVLPLAVVDLGYRCMFADNAFCSEQPGQSIESEIRRQSRITNRTLRAIWRNRHLLNPFRFPVFSFFLLSHKVVRFMVPLCLATSALCLALLALSRGVYLSAFIVAGLVSVAATAPRHAERLVPAGGRVLRYLNAFFMINVAVLGGWWKFVSRQPEVTWQHDRVGLSGSQDPADLRRGQRPVGRGGA